ncbi:sugar transporter [Aspergillus eucalypticola CBS 122712]|uniref:Sugar transporter n=1 Tax=Aspergillus eucalypticola (strain CBS 122712 / IBT 29274) TaxID=1448314 RepID=A0A317VJX3_ASPEC|nr:sugar transporter [Aspergillus eucalypticola CBS 122712]PWY73467.1 sugar transporter [Aspergillus eucalypticola CBS 122712]
MSAGIAVGLLVSYWVQYGALKVSGTAAWRMCFALQLVPGVLVDMLIYLRPKSPRWLFQHDRSDEAFQVLADLHGHGDCSDPFVQAEFQEIRVVVQYGGRTPPPSYLSLLAKAPYRRRTALAMGLHFMQNISSVRIVFYYAAKVFTQTGCTGTQAASLANGIGSSIFLVASFSLTVMIDRYGRRKPLIIGPSLMGICMIVVGILLVGYGSPYFDAESQQLKNSFANVKAGNAAVAFVFLHMISFGSTCAELPWTYQNEVFPISARGRGTAVSACIIWFTNFWLGLYMPEALKAAWKIYFVFGGVCIATSFETYLFYPETAQQSLEELNLLFMPIRRKLVCFDWEACQKGSLLHRISRAWRWHSSWRLR